MTENFEHDAHDYLLHQMDTARRSAFEREIERDPAARAALQAVADSLAGFACAAASPEPLSAAEQRAALNAIVAATHASPPGSVVATATRHAWRRFLWPAAAVFLLALNLLHFERPFAPQPKPTSLPVVKPNSSGSPGSPGSASNAAEIPGIGATPDATAPRGSASTSIASSSDEQTQELQRLRANVAELERAQRTLRAEYIALLERSTERAIVEKELNRLSTMELVDAASFARGERNGLVNVGRGILTEPGVVVATEPVTPPPTTGQTAPTPKQPYAWSVFDEKEGRGYVNLYNLPVPAGDQALQMWVRPADAKTFQRVGEVPAQFHGGNGSVQYAMPGTTAMPAEILVTLEPRATTPPSPTGPTVIRGP
jgi:anti-sigma-K factor RskA